jgi:hypothetical protein
VRRLVPALALCLAAAVALPSEADSRPYLRDPAGDANFLNDEKVGLPVPSTSTAPASLAQADITAVTLTTLYRGSGRQRRPAGTQVTMHLAGAPADGVEYEVVADWRGTCDGLRSSLSMYVLLDKQATIGSATCQSEDGASSNDVLQDYAVDPTARTVSWRTRATMPPGARVVSVAADTCVFTVGVYDDARTDGSWTYGR